MSVAQATVPDLQRAALTYAARGRQRCPISSRLSFSHPHAPLCVIWYSALRWATEETLPA